MQPIIDIQKLGKQYRFNQGKSRYLSLRDTLTSWNKRTKTADANHFWALKDLSLNILPGESLGVIGRNGAGKSTLLKVLSRITYPTTGFARMRGRVASLLEVGTGFHPELTGRENIFFNGSVLGLKRTEILDNFNDIVEFAGVNQFLDTPLKHYSSGMQLRLAFAVAAHLQPEILLIDEVLAVGDAAFQRKCLGKMDEVSRSGRTVIFVSHNMGAIQSLCQRVVWLDKGQIAAIGKPEEIIQQYLKHNEGSVMSKSLVDIQENRLGDGSIQMTDMRWIDSKGQVVNSLVSGGAYTIQVQYRSDYTAPLEQVYFDLGIRDLNQNHFANFPTRFEKPIPPNGLIQLHIPRLPLNAGLYPFNLFLGHYGKRVDVLRNVSAIQVLAGDYFGKGTLPVKNKMVLIDFNIEVNPLNKA